ncbi:hypothetical protein PMI04_009230 [Sphingobium sp. AP49]|uniref:hypothetical protein n=1 Tax=Sphingobium sp. AP49 TaxID=1144307 RepID=UPI0012F7063A|nr:hypothetical protein [Sphingobium sp. AP49]WHO40747.1 hypothetical protein PMI04_009230 [Sphingobium sp. AP49]
MKNRPVRLDLSIASRCCGLVVASMARNHDPDFGRTGASQARGRRVTEASQAQKGRYRPTTL